MYSLLYKKSVKKDLKKLPATVVAAIINKIQLLTDNPQPNGSTKLRGSNNLHRIRHADYRIIYQIDSGRVVIIIIKIAHRHEVYRDF